MSDDNEEFGIANDKPEFETITPVTLDPRKEVIQEMVVEDEVEPAEFTELVPELETENGYPFALTLLGMGEGEFDVEMAFDYCTITIPLMDFLQIATAISATVPSLVQVIESKKVQ